METVGEKFCDYNYKDKTPASAITETDPKSDFPVNLETSLNNVVKKEGYSKFNITKRQISTDGGNYLAVLYEADIKGKTKDGKNKEDNLFIKTIPPSIQFKLLDVYDAYCKELFVYTELAKIFNQIQDEASVPLEDRYKMPISYDESNSEVIILENMSRKGFSTRNRMEGITLEFAEKSIEQLAKFHALSLVLKENRPDYFEKKLKSMKVSFAFNDEWFKTMKHLSTLAIEPLSYDDKIRVQRFIEKSPDSFEKYCLDTTSQGCCFCHGDFRANNILTREENGISVEVVPVDYQLVYYGCPLNDFIYFIFLGSEKPFRDQHLDHLKYLYHDTLGKFLKYFNLNVEEIYPRKEFERQYKERLDMGLMYALFTMSFLFAEEDDVPDISKDFDNISVKMSKKYENRIKGLVEDFKNWGYL